MSHRATTLPLLALVLSALTAVNAGAAQRTFVSVSGSDTNACSVAAPCRSFGAAVAQTQVGGEVIALDSGGYGPVDISQSVSIIAPPGVYAGITAFSSTGINISGAAPTVVLRGLTINGLGGFIGIQVQAPTNANVVLERVVIRGFTYGLYAWGTNLQLVVRDSEFAQNDYGMTLLNGTHALLERIIVRHSLHYGIGLRSSFPTGNEINVEIRDSTLRANEYGVWSDGTMDAVVRDLILVVGQTHISANKFDAIYVRSQGTSTAKVTVAGATIVDNILAGVYVQCTTPGGVSNVVVTDSTITDNGTYAIFAGGTTCKASAGRNTIVRNNTGLYNFTTATGFASFVNNQIVDNVLPTFGTITPLFPQ